MSEVASVPSTNSSFDPVETDQYVCPECQQEFARSAKPIGQCPSCGYNLGATLKERVQKKQERRNKKRDSWQFNLDLSEEEVEKVCSQTVTELLSAMDSGKLSSETITLCFISRAQKYGVEFNAITEEFYDEAIEAARESDRRRAQGEPLGPLEGIPISVKDQYHQRGADSTCGMGSRVFQTYKDDGIHVKMLRDAGAIPFVRTNVGQGMMLGESDNFVYGQSLNPWDKTRTCGGSSGGEGALVAARCSPVGLGTDIGGSIRHPANYCGVCGFRPTPTRVSLLGTAAPFPKNRAGLEGIRPCCGPLGKSIDDLVHILKVWWSGPMSDADPFLPNQPFRADEYESERQLTVGYFVHSGNVRVSPAHERAVIETVEHLRKDSNYKVVEFPIDYLYDAIRIYLAIMTSVKDNKFFRDGLEGEDMHPSFGPMKLKLPGVVMSIMKGAASMNNQKRLAEVMDITSAKSPEDNWEWIARLRDLTMRFTREWKAAGLDALLCPPGGVPAPLHHNTVNLTPQYSYSTFFNVTHYPAGVVTVTSVREGEDKFEVEKPDHFDKIQQKQMVGSQGLPVSVQVAALPNQDEVCLRVMRDIQNNFGGVFPPPPTPQASH